MLYPIVLSTAAILKASCLSRSATEKSMFPADGICMPAASNALYKAL